MIEVPLSEMGRMGKLAAHGELLGRQRVMTLRMVDDRPRQQIENMPELQQFNVTVRISDPDTTRIIAEHVLPVDSPDAEYAAASTMSNAISFTTKTHDGAPPPVAFRVVKIELRG